MNYNEMFQHQLRGRAGYNNPDTIGRDHARATLQRISDREYQDAYYDAHGCYPIETPKLSWLP